MDLFKDLPKIQNAAKRSNTAAAAAGGAAAATLQSSNMEDGVQLAQKSAVSYGRSAVGR